MSCLETTLTLRIFSDSLNAREIGAFISSGNEVAVVSAARNRHREDASPSLWTWSSGHYVRSTDDGKHWVTLLRFLEEKKHEIELLRRCGCHTDICCFYVLSQPGGPSLNLHLLRSLARFDIEIWWDIYVNNDNDYA